MTDKPSKRRFLKVILGVGVAAYTMKAIIQKFSKRSTRQASGLAQRRACLAISDTNAVALVKDFEQQLQRGLLEGGDSSLQMLPSWIAKLPTGDEKGEFYAIDVGGTNLRVLHCQLGEGKSEVLTHDRKEIEIPSNRKTGKIHNLFDFVVASFKILMELNKRPYQGVKLHIGFCFSFPVDMEAIDSGTIVKMTKGFAFRDGVGQNAVQMLRETFAKSGIDAEVHVMCNDAVGVLAAGRYADPRTQIGVVLGTGTNAACVQRVESIRKWIPGLPKDLLSAVNIEWGAYVSEALPLADFDRELDRASPHPGEYLFEKMISGDYLGELVRLVLMSLCQEGLLLKANRMGELIRPYALTSAMVCEICSDQTAGYANTEGHLKTDLNVEPSLDDLRVIRGVSEMVVDRAATLIACALAATLVHVRREKPSSVEPILVSVDGSLYIKFDRLRKRVMSESNRMLDLAYGSGAPKFQVMPYLGGSAFGAAVLAAAAAPELPDEGDPAQFPELPYMDQ